MKVPIGDLVKEFRAFALKGNVIDLAVAVVMGAAFGGVVNAFVKYIIMPIVGYLIPNDLGYHGWHIGHIMIGEFLGEVIAFVATAAAVFFVIVKMLGRFFPKPAAGAPAPALKQCPACISDIPAQASKCKFCHSAV